MAASTCIVRVRLDPGTAADGRNSAKEAPRSGSTTTRLCLRTVIGSPAFRREQPFRQHPEGLLRFRQHRRGIVAGRDPERRVERGPVQQA